MTYEGMTQAEITRAMQVQSIFPVSKAAHMLDENPKVGILGVDFVNGFCTVGAGNLAPAVPNTQISTMIEKFNQLAKVATIQQSWPVAMLLDTHEPGKAEPPYPPHCERGTGEEELIDELAWLKGRENVSIFEKFAINGYIGTMYQDGAAFNKSALEAWIVENDIETLIVGGICTDICVLQVVQSLLSARNQGTLGKLTEIVVYEPACATYSLTMDTIREIGLPEEAYHPQFENHQIGLRLMQTSGAIIADEIIY